jgi:DNA-binding PadR family transcriptional regulator
MKEPIDLIEANAPEGLLDSKTTLRRDILMIFNYWHSEPLTAEKIKELLEIRGQSVKMDTIYKNLDSLVKNDILIKKMLPSKNARGRPPYYYELNKNAVYEQFRLLEDLLDACGFDPIDCDESGSAYVERFVIVSDGPLLPGFETIRSLRNSISGRLDVVIRLANADDFEKTWRLEQFIERLEQRCKTDSPAYKKYKEDRDYQDLVEECKRHNMLIPRKEDRINKPITFKITGPLYLHSDSPSQPKDKKD